MYIFTLGTCKRGYKGQKKQRQCGKDGVLYEYFDTAQGLNCGIDFSLVPQRAVDKVL